jgi:O-6-methylguanine DNA methyltransferase
MVGGMRAARTEYAVPGWGSGELWLGGGVVLAHEFEFERDAGAGVSAAPLEGAHVPPTSTVPSGASNVGHDSAPTSRHASAQDDDGSRAANDDLDADALVARFHAFFAGEDAGLQNVPVDLDWATPFQRAVAVLLRDIPRGEVVSYGELAALAGYPGAARAAGTFCARNRLMLLVPCHRVVGAAGLGGYGSAGLGVKRRLLELEGVRL